MSVHATTTDRPARTVSVKSKLIASAALLAGAAAAAGLGTFGSFTSTTSASEAVSSGTVAIALGSTGTADNRLSVAATGIVPGDTVSRAVKLSNSGSQNLSAITLTTTATTSSKLDTDTTNGLQITVQKCSSAWTEAGSATAGYTYTCSGTTSTVLASRAVIGSALALSNLSSLTSGSSDNLVVTLTLPGTADNTFQGLNSTVNVQFDGMQRTATGK